MGSTRYEIVLLSSGRQVQATEGETLSQALARAGIQLRSDCGGKGTCGKCVVVVEEENGTERHHPAGADTGSQPSRLVERLACQHEVRRNLTIEIRPTSLAPAELIDKPTPLRRFTQVRTTPATALASAGYGLAIDLGTTTVALFLCDPAHGVVLASATMHNPQNIFGDDVMSRVKAAASAGANLTRMQELVVAAANQTVASLADHCGIRTEEIATVVVVGNPCMIHLFLGVDPRTLGTYPYQPVFTGARELAGADLGLLGLHPEARLRTLPLISGFLGCDLVAATMANDLDFRADETLLLDVGTNGEAMLNVRGELSATSCATGPALEGAAISHGMHAVSGAVDSVKIDPVDARVSYSLIQRNPEEPRKAAGICGSGIVSAIAAALRAGVILDSGRFNPESNHPNLRPTSGGGVEFVLVPAEETHGGLDITVSQKDVRAVQLAKAALRAGITILCREARIELPRRLLIAGAFGSFLIPGDAMTIGMLPRLPEDAVETVGNAAGEGAILALLHEDSAGRAAKIARRTRVVDLASHPDFQKVYLDSLAFPRPHERSRP